MKNSVLLVQPAWQGGTEETMCIPLGLAWIASVVREAGADVDVIDFLIDHQNSWQEKLTSLFNSKKYKIVGVQFHSTASFNASCKAAKYLKDNWPNIFIVVGGETATKYHSILLQENFVDFVVDGEGEITFKEIVLKYIHSEVDFDKTLILGGYTKNILGKVISTGKRDLISDLDTLPFPAREIFNIEKYPQWSIFTSRGCPYGCTFCSASSWWRHRIRYRSIENAVEELKSLITKYKIKEIYIGDDIFTHNRDRVLDFCQNLKDEKININWTCLTRADCVDYELLSVMKEAGCAEISYGLESANDKTLKLVNKRETSENIRNAILMSRELNIHVRVTVIIGLPGESVEDVRRTKQFLLDTMPNQIQLYSLAAYDGTVLFGNIENLGVRILETDKSKWRRNVLNPMCETDCLKKNEIIELALEIVESLKEKDYIHFDSSDNNIKQGLSKVVYTGFCPVQSIGDARNS